MSRRDGRNARRWVLLTTVLVAAARASAQPRPVPTRPVPTRPVPARPVPARPVPTRPVSPVPTPLAGAVPAADDLVAYRVRAGDTCTSIALRMYHDARRTDLVHAYNDLGPPPHRLAPGQTLRLPRRAPLGRGPVPDARLTAAHNQVAVFSPEERPGRQNDPLFRGSRVSTQAQSSAEVTFADETQLRLSEQTLVVILGDTSAQARRVATARDTTLVTGTLRAYLGALAGRAPAVPVNTPGATVLLGTGESEVRVDALRATTLAVYHGRSRLRTRRRVVLVPEGYSVRAEVGHDPAPPRRLPPTATWTTVPQGVVFASAEGTATVTGTYAAESPGTVAPGTVAPGTVAPPTVPPATAAPGAAPGAAVVAGWHVQLARDPRFDDPLTDARVPVTVTTLEARGLRPGSYVARVSALDDQGVEGPWSPEVRVVVAQPRVVPTAAAHRASVELPAGAYCAVDEGTLAPTGVAPIIDTLRPHGLRCGLSADGATAATTLPREPLGPLTALARLVDADPVARHGRVRVRLLDHAGEAVTDPGIQIAVPTGVIAGDPSETGEPGVRVVPVTWPVGARSVVLHVTVGDEAVDTAAVTLPPPPPPPPPAPAPTLLHRFELRLEGAGGTVLTGFQRNQDPGMYSGVTRGFGPVYGGSARLALRLAGPLWVQAGGATWVFPSSAATSDGRATLYAGGLVLALGVGSVGRVVVEGNAGVALTGPYTRFGFDLGAGFEFALGRAVGLGPMVRYVHVVQPASDVLPYDAAFWTAGLSLTLRVPPPRVPSVQTP